MITGIPFIISSNVQVFQTMVEEVHNGRGTAIQSSRQWEEKNTHEQLLCVKCLLLSFLVLQCLASRFSPHLCHW